MESYQLISRFVEWVSFRDIKDLKYHISRNEFKVTWEEKEQIRG